MRAAYHEHDEVFAVIPELKRRGIKVALLSNTEMPAVGIFEERHYEGLFDVAVFSCVEHVRKPDERIYRIALERLGVRPEEAVFLDDRAENVKAAQKLGMHAIHVTSPPQAVADLKKLLTASSADR